MAAPDPAGDPHADGRAGSQPAAGPGGGARPQPEPAADPHVEGRAGSGPPGGTDADGEVVAHLLGRQPMGAYTVVVRRPDGQPVVVRNEPLLGDGRPMPTRYWLLDPALNKAIGQLEAEGGVRRAEAEVDPGALARAHEMYAAERDAALPPDHTGPRPSGGVGGTRRGVKCLHTHYAHHLAGGDDPVGRWVHRRLGQRGQLIDVVRP